MAVYTVVKGDTLYGIAKKYNTHVDTLVENNNIKDPDYIVVGQEISIDSKASSTPTATQRRVTIKLFGLLSNTDRTVYATWDWPKNPTTEHYEVKWYYRVENNDTWFVGQNGTEEEEQSMYTAPENATSVQFLTRPIAKTKTTNGKESTPWSAEWSTAQVYSFKDNPPGVPPVPTVTVKGYRLTAELLNLDRDELNALRIEFQLYNSYGARTSLLAAISEVSTQVTFTIEAGVRYRVRCRAVRGLPSDSNFTPGEWTDYTDAYTSFPAVPSGFTVCRASSETSVYLEWASASGATSYDIEYSTKKEYLGASDQSTTTGGIETTHYDISGLESGKEYFFRLRAVNDKGDSEWSETSSVIVGKDPSAPTTWSSTTTVVTGESLTLYWVHNSEDGSSQTYAELELSIGGVTETHTIQNSTDEDEKDKTSFFSINTSSYTEGTQILWRVRTAGVTVNYGDWSVQRTVDVYAPPTLSLNVTNVNGDALDVLSTFPFYIYALAGPNTQAPTGYHLTIAANESYETVDSLGNSKTVNKGDNVYFKFFDTNDPLLVEMSASNVNLDNNISYTIICTVSMNSGLTVESSSIFKVAWTDDYYEPNAEIAIDDSTYAASIRPYCITPEGETVTGITLSVYRREFDGNFTEIAADLDGSGDIFVTDPHPALDYARYRVVATSSSTGAISYYDVPGYPVNGKSAVIQWDEQWVNFSDPGDAVLTQPDWSGSMLKIPYNIDITESTNPDVDLIEYVGRSNPVVYYGTHIGETFNWTMEIPKSDKETLYGLRRLQKWMGNVYVRDPSGCGYWGHVKVTFSQKHLAVTIPITISVTRVEGGI